MCPPKNHLFYWKKTVMTNCMHCTQNAPRMKWARVVQNTGAGTVCTCALEFSGIVVIRTRHSLLSSIFSFIGCTNSSNCIGIDDQIQFPRYLSETCCEPFSLYIRENVSNWTRKEMRRSRGAHTHTHTRGKNELKLCKMTKSRRTMMETKKDRKRISYEKIGKAFTHA